jgi:Domain of unknown function (DUF397)
VTTVATSHRTGTWRKARASEYEGGAGCVELALEPGTVGVRDSKFPAGGRLTLPDGARTALVSFATGYRTGYRPPVA